MSAEAPWWSGGQSSRLRDTGKEKAVNLKKRCGKPKAREDRIFKPDYLHIKYE